MMQLQTNHPIAETYEEHTKRDTDPAVCIADFRNKKFNNKLYELWPFEGVCANVPPLPPMRILDLGCSVGGFIDDCINDGHIGVGVEGTDWYINNMHQTVNWPNHPNPRKRNIHYNVDDFSSWHKHADTFFCADITRPFLISDLSRGQLTEVFDVITAWEVMEHMKTEDLPGLFENIRQNLSAHGIWIMSVSTQPGAFHRTVQQRNWWVATLQNHGFELQPDLVKHFGDQWIRGPKQHAPQSFHLICKKVTNEN